MDKRKIYSGDYSGNIDLDTIEYRKIVKGEIDIRKSNDRKSTKSEKERKWVENQSSLISKQTLTEPLKHADKQLQN